MDFVEQIYPAVAEQARNALSRLNDDGLLEIEAWNMLDWAPMDTPEKGVVTHQNAWLVEALRRSAVLANLLGKTDDAQHYEAAADQLKDAINAHLWSDEHKAYIDSIHDDGARSPVISQQTNTVAFLCDVPTPQRRRIVGRYVSDVPADWVRIGSPFMMFFTFEALAKLGAFETILQITRQRWGEMLDQDATTCWETFPGFDRHWLTRSHCHAWSAAPTYFLSAYQLGVFPLEAGFRRVLVAPIPAGLRWARGCVATTRGGVAVEWRHSSGQFNLSLVIPAGIEAMVRLPECVPQEAEVDVTGAVAAEWSESFWQVGSVAGPASVTARW
jgi:hypothetical protein